MKISFQQKRRINLNLQDEVLNSFNNKDIVVTGGTGLIGRQVVNLLLEANANVRVISLDKINLSNKVEFTAFFNLLLFPHL